MFAQHQFLDHSNPEINAADGRGVSYNRERLHKAGYFRELLASSPNIEAPAIFTFALATYLPRQLAHESPGSPN